MRIHEIIPLTIQGEGFNTGMPCSFIRLWGCPVGCHFCDTGYAKGTGSPDFKDLTIDQILSELQSTDVVITGGEPTTHPDFISLIRALISNKYNIYLETAGIRWNEILHKIKWITLSPKDHVSNHKSQLLFWIKANEIKLVVENENDYRFYQNRLNLSVAIARPTYLQPEWSKRDQIMPYIMQTANKIGAQVSIQTHKYVGLR